MFIGRNFELDNLNKIYKRKSFELIVLYGRRRIGKTTLISEFCKDKGNIFYVAQEHNDKIALQNFSDKILNYFGMKEFISTFESWEKAFLFLAKQCKNEQLVLVIDEFPYIVNSNKSIPSLLQNVIDHHLKDTKLFIILCGSSMSFMEKEVLSYKSPLYGRRTAQFKIEPFDFYDSSRFFPGYSLEEKVQAYGILGGIPQYLLMFKDNLTIDGNIKTEILNKISYLYEEPKNLLKQELREPATYVSIIEAIAKGYTKLNEISTKIGESSDKCAKYLSTLNELRIVKKETPIGTKENNRKTLYKLEDNLFKFWYRFLPDNVTLIEQQMVEYVYENSIKPEINHYLGEVYEEICMQFLLRMNKDFKLPFVFQSIGRWWGNNPLKKCQEEIDIVAINKDNALFGECKWRNELLDIDVVNSLVEKSVIINSDNKYYAFFSKSGFTNSAIKYAENNKNVFLFSLKDIDLEVI